MRRTPWMTALFATLTLHLAAADRPATTLHWIAMTGAGDERPVFGTPVEVAIDAVDPIFAGDGALTFRQGADGVGKRWRSPAGPISVDESTTSPAPAPPTLPSGEVLDFVPGPEGGRLTLLVRNAPEFADQDVFFDYDPATKALKPIIAAPAGARVFAWDNAGRLWAAEGTQLFRHCPACGGGWRRMVDVRRFGLSAIVDFALAPDGGALAVVVGPPAQP